MFFRLFFLSPHSLSTLSCHTFSLGRSFARKLAARDLTQAISIVTLRVSAFPASPCCCCPEQEAERHKSIKNARQPATTERAHTRRDRCCFDLFDRFCEPRFSLAFRLAVWSVPGMEFMMSSGLIFIQRNIIIQARHIILRGGQWTGGLGRKPWKDFR